MSKHGAKVLACVGAVAVSALTQRGAAEDSKVIERNRQGDIVLRDDEAGFGEVGQWTFSTDAALDFKRRTQSNATPETTLSIFPATDYFIIENLSVGGAIGVGYNKVGSEHSTRFLLGPRVGYNFEISRLLSVWPKLGFSYSHLKSESKRAAGDGSGRTVSASTTNDAVQLNIFVPVMVHPAPHFFAGFGPFLDTDLSGDNRVTVWGFKLTLGGWV